VQQRRPCLVNVAGSKTLVCDQLNNPLPAHASAANPSGDLPPPYRFAGLESDHVMLPVVVEGERLIFATNPNEIKTFIVKL
jgi:hypothetical protein